jgi:hypothetical protein
VPDIVTERAQLRARLDEIVRDVWLVNVGMGAFFESGDVEAADDEEDAAFDRYQAARSAFRRAFRNMVTHTSVYEQLHESVSRKSGDDPAMDSPSSQ